MNMILYKDLNKIMLININVVYVLMILDKIK